MDMALNPQIQQKWRLFLTSCTTSTLSSLTPLHDSAQVWLHCYKFIFTLPYYHISSELPLSWQTPLNFYDFILLHLAINGNFSYVNQRPPSLAAKASTNGCKTITSKVEEMSVVNPIWPGYGSIHTATNDMDVPIPNPGWSIWCNHHISQTEPALSNNTSVGHRCKYYMTYGNISKPSEAFRTPYQPSWPCTSSANISDTEQKQLIGDMFYVVIFNIYIIHSSVQLNSWHHKPSKDS